jgi:N-ethylmaleimide reductase
MTVPPRRHLFTPVQIGPITLKHRVVMAPLTRSRSEQPGDIPGRLMLEYYAQRASDGGFIVSEGTSVSLTGAGGLVRPACIRTNRSRDGRRSPPPCMRRAATCSRSCGIPDARPRVEMAGGHMPVSASVDPSYWEDASHVVSAPSGWIKPSPHRALDIGEIPGIIEDYRKAAERAKAAGFDGVELHAANGYLPDRFLQDGSNQRTDAYGGCIENRSRFPLELVETLASVWGGDRVAASIGPSGTWNGMSDSNPQALFLMLPCN